MSDHANVIDLAAEREARSPHIAGECMCLACKHRWTGVAPVGVNEMECPECGTMRGVWFYPLALPDGTNVWTCKCGNDLFVLCETAIFCVSCGQVHDWRPGE